MYSALYKSIDIVYICCCVNQFCTNFCLVYIWTARPNATSASTLHCSVKSQSSPKGETAPLPKKQRTLYVLTSVMSQGDQYATKNVALGRPATLRYKKC